MNLCHNALLAIKGRLLETLLNLTCHVCLLIDPLAQIILSLASKLDLLLQLSTKLVVHQPNLLPSYISILANTVLMGSFLIAKVSKLL